MITVAITEPVLGLTNRTDYLYIGQGNPISISGQRGSRWTATVVFIVRAGDSYTPTEGTPIYVLDVVGSPGTTTCNCAGTIDTIERKWIGDRGDHIDTLTCVSFEQCFDTIEVFPARVYFNKTAGYIINDLLTNVATGVPVIAGTISDGQTIPSAVYTRKDRLTDIFTSLATTCGFVWFVDPGTSPGTQALQFHAPSTQAAPFTLQSSQILWETLDWRQTRADYRNRQTRTIAFAAFSSSNKMFAGDGSTDHFDLPWPADQVLTAMLTDGTQALAIGGLVSAGSPATLLPSNGDTVTITPPRSPAVVEDPYTFVDTLDNTLRNQVLIDTTGATTADKAANTIQNLVDAINAEPSRAGITFSLPTWENDSCNADPPNGLNFVLRVKNPGSGGNGIALTTTCPQFQWSNFDSPATATTDGGTDGTIQVLNVGALPAANVSNDIYYEKGSTTIYCAVAPPTGVSLSISYNRLDADSISVEDSTQVATRAALEHGTGKYQVAVNDSSTTDAKAGYLAALKDLAAFGELPGGGMPVAFQFQTDKPNLLPGQYLAIALSENPVGTPSLIDGTYIVQTIQAILVPGMDMLSEPYGHLRYTVGVVNLAGVSTYIALWENLVIIPKPTNTPTSSNSPAALATPTVTSDPATGNLTTNPSSTTSAGPQWVQEVIGRVALFKATDLVVDASNNQKVTSASYSFVAGDVGLVVVIIGGTGWTTGTYNISSVASGAAVLDASPAPVSTTGGVWAKANPKLYCTSWTPAKSSYTGNQIIVLSKNGLQLSPFKSGDVGYKINTPPIDYTIQNGNQVLFVTAPALSDVFVATYFPDGIVSNPQNPTPIQGKATVIIAVEANLPFIPHSPGGDKTNIDLVKGTSQQLMATTSIIGVASGYTLQQAHDVTWKIDPNTPYGTLKPATVANQYGNPSYLYQIYTAPATVPSNPLVRVIATSNLDKTQTAVELIHIIASVTLCKPASGTALNSGTWTFSALIYAFLMAESSGTTVADSKASANLTIVDTPATQAEDTTCGGFHLHRTDPPDFTVVPGPVRNSIGGNPLGIPTAFSVFCRFRLTGASLTFDIYSNEQPWNGDTAGSRLFFPAPQPTFLEWIISGTDDMVAFFNVGDLRDGAWHTIVATTDGTQQRAGCFVYLDGGSALGADLSKGTDETGSTPADTSAQMVLGRSTNGVAQTQDWDTLQFYNRVLNSTEATALNTDPFLPWR